MRIGLVSPYPWDVPGGVVAHIADLAEALIARGHHVQVITPVDDEDAVLPSYVTRAGRSVPIPYNGSVSRLLIGPVSQARLRRWLREGDFDVLHIHSPETFSLSLLAMGNATGPIVATFHASQARSRILAILQNPLQVYLERLSGRIAVSPAARKTIVDHLGGDAVVVPNGVNVARFRGAEPFEGYPGVGGTLGFVGRIDEPRKGLQVLLDAVPILRREFPNLRVLVAGPGEIDDVPPGVTLLGRVSEADKARAFASVNVFVAPNTGGESFGIILIEAMASGAPIVASDLDPFARVLDDGAFGVLAKAGDAYSLAEACATLLRSPERRAELRAAGLRAVERYDWSVVAGEILRVYETAIAAKHGKVEADPEPVDEAALEVQLTETLKQPL
jgi:phosphatidylinositol alpha-mannosyltransferase